MAQANLAPFELISYRGLLKSAHDIKNDYLTLPNKPNPNERANGKSELVKARKHFIVPMRDFIIFQFVMVVNAIEKLLFYLMSCYDLYLYTPLQICLKPVVKQIPRYAHIFDMKVPIFTANIVTLSRTLLAIPIVWCLKYDLYQTAFACVALHDFLDHLDGIVAKVHRQSYPNHDDPLLGGFLDAFCDKVVNCLAIWSIIQAMPLQQCTYVEMVAFLFVSYGVIFYETLLGIVRCDDFFLAKFKREFKITEKNSEMDEDPTKVVAATMEGKLKEKLESVGIALLCLSLSTKYLNPINNICGIIGLICLALTLRMAHKSLMQKIRARQQLKLSSASESSSHQEQPNNQEKTKVEKTEDDEKEEETITAKVANLSAAPRSSVWGMDLTEMMTNSRRLAATHPSCLESAQMPMVDYKCTNHGDDKECKEIVTGELLFAYKRPASSVSRHHHISECPIGDDECNSSSSYHDADTTDADADDEETKTSLESPCMVGASIPRTPQPPLDNRVDKVYTIGCFDLFHRGHAALIKRMRELGKTVIVGVHDSRSIYQLKNRVPVDSTEKRMLNVKALADQVFCIASCDPSNFVTCIVHVEENETALYVRGDDMPDFPSRKVVETLMPIKFLPYTLGVSSTLLRAQNFSHIAHNDEDHLERNS